MTTERVVGEFTLWGEIHTSPEDLKNGDRPTSHFAMDKTAIAAAVQKVWTPCIERAISLSTLLLSLAALPTGGELTAFCRLRKSSASKPTWTTTPCPRRS
jgi:hypothetical protein